MNYDNIKTLDDLADFLNQCEDWPNGIEDLCADRGWTYHDGEWDVASFDGEIVTLKEVSNEYAVVPYEEEETETEYVILKANAFARFAEVSEEAEHALHNNQYHNEIDFDGAKACLWGDECLIVERNEYLKREEYYKSEVAHSAKCHLRNLIINILDGAECKYRIDGEEDILVETPTQEEIEKYL